VRVAFIAREWEYDAQGQVVQPGPATYYRCLLPAASLREYGGHDAWVFNRWGTSHGEIVPCDRDGTHYHGWDVVVLHHSWVEREMVDAIEIARDLGQIVILDADDHALAVHWSSRAATHPDYADNYNQAFLAASHVTVSTPFLAEVVRGLGQSNVTVLRNMIDLRLWDRQPVRDRVRLVGWVGLTTRLRPQDLGQLGTGLRRFLRAHPAIRFLHAGDAPDMPRAAKLIGVPASLSVERPCVRLEGYPALWRDIDIALCPLNPNSDYNRAKSALKCLESSAAGVPFVASDLDEYRAYSAGWGRLASTPREWQDALEALLDREARQDLADRAHERVLKEDCSVRYREWSDLYERLGTVDSSIWAKSDGT